MNPPENRFLLQIVLREELSQVQRKMQLTVLQRCGVYLLRISTVCFHRNLHKTA